MIVVMPWRDTGDPHRRAHYWRLRAWYQIGGFQVVAGDRPGPFNRSAARNAGAAMVGSGDVVALVDADNLIDPQPLHDAGLTAQRTGRMVKPFTHFGYLTEQATDDWYRHGALPGLDQPDVWENDPQTGFSGGAYVLTRQAWDRVGGFDEGFTGWGGEDDAFTLECARILGPTQAIPGIDYHLWHPSPGRWASEANYQRLQDRYVNR